MTQANATVASARPPLRPVLVGCGGMANHWVSIVTKSAGMQLVGLTDIRREAAQAMADKHHLSQDLIFGSLSEALARTDANAVFDVTVPSAHCAVALEAFAAGRHVLGEKPMAESLTDARRMVVAAQQAGCIHAILQNRRYNPQIRGLRRFLLTGAIGAIEELHADMVLGPHFGGFRELMDHPLLIDMAIHTFDAARFIAGADPVSVYCHAFNPPRSWYRGAASAVAIFEMTNGIVFSYRGSWCAEGLPVSWDANWRVIGNKGTALWDGGQSLKAQSVDSEAPATFFRKVKDLTIEPAAMEHVGHAAVINEFARCVSESAHPETASTDNIKSLAMVLAAVESAATGRKVAVEW